jgi:hypothetical protein
MRRFLCLLLLCVGAAHASGPWRAGERNTSGWAYMTPRERLEHHQLQHHEAMEARAQASGQTLKPASERRDLCEHLRPTQAKP